MCRTPEMIIAILITICLISISGCQTAYGPETLEGGFIMTPTNEEATSYKVQFRSNAWTTVAKVKDYAVLASAESCYYGGFLYYTIMSSYAESQAGMFADGTYMESYGRRRQITTVVDCSNDSGTSVYETKALIEEQYKYQMW